MTAKETQRLAKVEQKVDDLKESTDTGFADVKQSISDNNKSLNDKLDASNKTLNDKLDAFISHADKSFITKAQAQAVGWMLGFLLGLGTLIVLVYNAFHGGRP